MWQGFPVDGVGVAVVGGGGRGGHLLPLLFTVLSVSPPGPDVPGLLSPGPDGGSPALLLVVSSCVPLLPQELSAIGPVPSVVPSEPCHLLSPLLSAEPDVVSSVLPPPL